jgi:hypothetical protein
LKTSEALFALLESALRETFEVESANQSIDPRVLPAQCQQLLTEALSSAKVEVCKLNVHLKVHELDEIQQKGGIDSEIVSRMLRCHIIYGLEKSGAWVRETI